MPGIIGIASNEGADQHRIVLDRMVKPLLRSPLLEVACSVNERFAIGTVNHKTMGQGLAQMGSTWLAFSGLIVEGNGFTPSQEQYQCPSLAQALLDRYLHQGLRGVCGLNGLYTLAIWEEELQRLTLINDRVGYSNLYYWHNPGRFLFSSEYKSISCQPGFNKTIDPAAVADQFTYGFMTGGRTLFRDIHALPPASILTYQHDRVEIKRYWEPAFFVNGAPQKQDGDYADELAEYMRLAIQRRVQPNTCMLITGGLDSRAIAGIYQAVAPDVQLVTSTVGLPTGQDVLLGKEVAGALGYPHFHIPLGDDYLARYSALSTWITEGKNGAYASWILAQLPFLQKNELSYTLTGLFGNFISGRHYPADLYQAQTIDQGAESARSVFRPYLKGLAEVMRPEIFKEAGEESINFVSNTFRQANTPSLFQRFDRVIFYLLFASAGHTADALGDAALPLEPFLDNDLLDFATACIPPAVRSRSLFYHQLIVRHLPKAAQVPYGRTGYSVKVDLHIAQNPTLAWLDDKRRRALKRFFPNHYSSEARSSVPHAGAIRRASRRHVEAVLSRKEYLADLFEPAAIQRVLEDHIAGRQNNYRTIDALLTFALWRQQFCDLDGPLPETGYSFAPSLTYVGSFQKSIS